MEVRRGKTEEVAGGKKHLTGGTGLAAGEKRGERGSAGSGWGKGKKRAGLAHVGKRKRRRGFWASGWEGKREREPTQVRKGEERERVLGWAEGERSGPAGWAPFYSFSFSTLH
jgi:hypothetical protein